jgi:WD40 repeat protein
MGTMRRAIVILAVAACALAATYLEAVAQSQPRLALETGGHMALIRSILFTPDGKQLISAGDDKVIRIWDVASGRTVRTLRGEIGDGLAGKIYALALSPDGKLLAAAGRMEFTRPGTQSIRLYDLETAQIAGLLEGHSGPILSLAFSADGRQLASGSSDGTAILWDVKTRAKLHQFRGHTGEVNRVAFTLDGERLATAGDDRRVMLWRLSDGRQAAQTAQFLGRVFGLAVSPVTGEIAASTQEGEVALLDDRTGRTNRLISSQGSEFLHLSFSPDGRWLLTGAGASPYHCLVIDVERGQPAFIYRGHQHLVAATAISPDGRFAATAGGRDNEIHLWDLASGALVKAMQGSGAGVLSVGFSGDGKELAFGQTNVFHSIHDRGPLEYVLRLAGPGTRTDTPQRNMDQAKAFTRARIELDQLTLANRAGGKFGYNADLDIRRDSRRIATIHRDEKSGFVHNAYTFVPNVTAVVAGAGNGVLTAHSLNGASLSPEFVGHFGDVWAVAASPDGRLLVSGADDQTVRLWNVASRELIATLFYGRDGEWVMWTPQGYYSSSPGGDNLVGWHINRGPGAAANFIAARQLKQHFFRPDIVDEAIRRASAQDATKDEVATFQIADLNRRLPPELMVVSPQPNSAHTAGRAIVTIAVTEDTSDPVQAYTITVGDRRVPVVEAEPDHAAALRTPGSAFSAGRRVAFEVPLAEGSNLVRIAASNATGESQPLEFQLEQRGEGALDGRGTLYIVAVGVDAYGGGGSIPNLRFAGADAKSFEAEVRRRFAAQHSKIDSRLLVSGAGGSLEPTRANIAAALSDLRRATPNDTVVVFLAGHGDNLGSDYFFLSADATREGEGWAADSVLSWHALLDSLAGSAGRRFLFVDTCRSANAFNFRLIKDAADADIIAYSATNRQQDALELETLGHGVFTHALVQGLAGEADTNHDKVIRVFELGNFLAERVLQLTNGVQTPDFYRSVGSMNLVLVRL